MDIPVICCVVLRSWISIVELSVELSYHVDINAMDFVMYVLGKDTTKDVKKIAGNSCFVVMIVKVVSVKAVKFVKSSVKCAATTNNATKDVSNFALHVYSHVAGIVLITNVLCFVMKYVIDLGVPLLVQNS